MKISKAKISALAGVLSLAGVLVALLLYALRPESLPRLTILGDQQLFYADEPEDYFLAKPDQHVFSGPVKQMGWNDRFIIAERGRSISEGWTIIDVQTGVVREQLPEADFRQVREVQGIRLYTAEEAWKQLGGKKH